MGRSCPVPWACIHASPSRPRTTGRGPLSAAEAEAEAEEEVVVVVVVQPAVVPVVAVPATGHSPG